MKDKNIQGQPFVLIIVQRIETLKKKIKFYIKGNMMLKTNARFMDKVFFYGMSFVVVLTTTLPTLVS